MRHYRN